MAVFLIAGCGGANVGDGSGDTGVPDLTQSCDTIAPDAVGLHIINNTSVGFDERYFTHSTNLEWGDNLLGGDVLASKSGGWFCGIRPCDEDYDILILYDGMVVYTEFGIVFAECAQGYALTFVDQAYCLVDLRGPLPTGGGPFQFIPNGLSPVYDKIRRSPLPRGGGGVCSVRCG